MRRRRREGGGERGGEGEGEKEERGREGRGSEIQMRIEISQTDSLIIFFKTNRKWSYTCMVYSGPHKPVGVVEANLLNDNVHEQVPDSGGERWEGVATLISSQFHQVVLEIVEEKANNKHIEGNSAKSLLVHLPVYLRWGWKREGREEGKEGRRTSKVY